MMAICKPSYVLYAFPPPSLMCRHVCCIIFNFINCSHDFDCSQMLKGRVAGVHTTRSRIQQLRMRNDEK
ncbi:hypothetical protein B9Z55_025325 [Caenorhabditis nigoni]|uniref:Uncharacterized protein n=1 Tax=Caenorhabditis nigoni TaxID=1611254 RepID=A0A2G5SYQ2_9PELO|nr:hypothetical protein B9Z55_025325 [Caenorhabditis nigoni]